MKGGNVVFVCWLCPRAKLLVLFLSRGFFLPWSYSVYSDWMANTSFEYCQEYNFTQSIECQHVYMNTIEYYYILCSEAHIIQTLCFSVQ